MSLTAKDSDSYATRMARFPLKLLSTFTGHFTKSPDVKEYFKTHSLRCIDIENPLHDDMHNLANEIDSLMGLGGIE